MNLFYIFLAFSQISVVWRATFYRVVFFICCLMNCSFKQAQQHILDATIVHSVHCFGLKNSDCIFMVKARFWWFTKHLMNGPNWKQWVLFPWDPQCSQGEAQGNIEIVSHWEFCFTFQLKNRKKLAWLDACSMSGKSKPVLLKPYCTFFFCAANYNKDINKVALASSNAWINNFGTAYFVVNDKTISYLVTVIEERVAKRGQPIFGTRF